MKTLTRAELLAAGVTVKTAREWPEFYENEVIRIPRNPSARGRAELMVYAQQLWSPKMSETFDFELRNPKAAPVELAIEPWGMIYEIESGQTIRVSIELDEYAVFSPPSIQYDENLISLWIEGMETFHLFRGEVEIDPEVWAPAIHASTYKMPRAA